jgi:biopolymer transport protein ExbD
MAEMQTADSGGSKKKGGTRSKKMSTRIDFTPMVDLGFLLITFFMLTTTLQKPQTMQIVMPEKDIKPDEKDPIKQSKVLTLLLGKNDKVYWYRGIENAVLDSCDYSATGLRKIILDSKEKVRAEHGMDKKMEKLEDGTEKEVEKSHLVVLIKPNDNSVYKNMVDALDEMAITGVSKYVMMDISKDEQNFILNPAKGLAYKAPN